MIIAVIDDGINTNVIDGTHKLSFDISCFECNDKPKLSTPTSQKFSHGTTCAAIIMKYAPTATLGSVRVLSSIERRCKATNLCQALRWCIKNRIKLVNMSLGSCNINDFHMIRVAVQDFLDAGGLIIAAQSNNRIYTLPACIPGVIGVAVDTNLVEDQYCVVKQTLYNVQVHASGRHIIKNPNGTTLNTPCSCSCAAPLITAIVHNLWEKHTQCTAQEILELFLGRRQESVLEQLYNTHFPQVADVSVPTIILDSNICKGTVLGEKLVNDFNSRYFPSLLFTSKGSMNSIEIPSQISPNAFLDYAAHMFELSIIIVSEEAFIKGDWYIFTDCQKYTRNCYIGNKIILPTNFTDTNIRNAVSYIIRAYNV